MSNIAWSPEERIEAYAILESHGITGLEIAPGLFFHGADDPFVPEEPVAREALDEARAAGLTLVSMQSLLFGVDGAALFEGEEARIAFETGMVRAVELAGRFEIPNLVFGSPRQRCVPNDMWSEDALSQAADVFRRLGDRAVAMGTRIAIEANPAAYGTNFLTTFDEAAAFVDRTDHPGIVAILDLGAMHMNGTFDTVPALIPAHVPMLNHVHVSEPDLAPAPRDTSALSPVLAALRDNGYGKSVSIEMKRPAGGLRDVAASASRLAEAFEMAGAAYA